MYGCEPVRPVLHISLKPHHYTTAYTGAILEEPSTPHDNEVFAGGALFRTDECRKSYFSPVPGHSLAERFNHSFRAAANCESIFSIDAVSDDLQLFIRKTCSAGKMWEVPVPLLRTTRAASAGDELTWCYYSVKL